MTTPRSPLLVDLMLGRLVPYHRVCGYDTAYAGDRGLLEDEELLAVANEEARTILTRDRELATRAARAVLLESKAIDGQLAELRQTGLVLEPTDQPRRCGRCNGRLEPESHPIRRPEYVPSDPELECFYCVSCGQYFWMGSHWERISQRL